ncbi:MAG: TetR/AcrR family transcriptional regulator [Chitinophagales bacterium]
MKGTKKNIIQTAIDLFNQRGVGNVRVRDIADAAELSPGNLTYHFKTKKDIIDSVYRYMLKQLSEIKKVFLKSSNAVTITKDYLKFQLQFRFFYRDILEIIHLYPEIKDSFKEQIFHLIRFNRKVLYVGVDMGYLIEEPSEGLYDSLARNSWAIQNSWLLAREILGEETISIAGGVKSIMDLHYPYLTEKGRAFYYHTKEELKQWVESEILEMDN